MITWLHSSFCLPIPHTLTLAPTSRTRAHTPFRAITKTANRGITSAPIRRQCLTISAAMFLWQQMRPCHFANQTHNGLRQHITDVRCPTDSPLGHSRMSTTSRPGSGLDVHIRHGVSLHFSTIRCLIFSFYVASHSNRPDPDCSGVIISLAWSRLSPWYLSVIIRLSLPSSLMSFRAHLTINDISILSMALQFRSLVDSFTRTAACTSLSHYGRQIYAKTPLAQRRDIITRGPTRSRIQAFPNPLLTDQPLFQSVKSWISSILLAHPIRSTR